jgi:hypothetical protein
MERWRLKKVDEEVKMQRERTVKCGAWTRRRKKENWSEGWRGSVHVALGLDNWVSGGLRESGTRVFFSFLIVPIDARQDRAETRFF